MSENAVVKAEPRLNGAVSPVNLNNLQDVLQLGEVLARSGFFADARSAAQAVVKVLAGRELGFASIASMVGIHIIEGKPVVGAHLMASMIKRSGRYDYRVVTLNRSECSVEFLERRGEKWEPLGRVSMTFAEATETGLALGKDGRVKANWARNADDMLFARCISKGYRRYCPDLTGGVLVYEPDEMDGSQPLDVTPVAPPAPTGEPIDASYTVTHPDGAQTPVSDQPEEPRPNPQAPAAEAGDLTEQEEQTLVTAARTARRTVAEVNTVLKIVGVPVLKKVPREKLEWVRKALAEGLCPQPQVDRISKLVNELNLSWEAFRTRLTTRYGRSSLGHLTVSEATEVEEKLKAAPKPQQQLPAPQPV
ncbi:MAG: hypothetical protein IT429_14875 [Gemmataceae bacterium]|nr:hypothetical protein [Gemmataceae bacterium]